jgi:hypothetical protein
MLLATLVATLFGFGLGMLWYGPWFGRAWMAENGFTPEQPQSVRPGRTYGLTFGLGFVAAYAFGDAIGPDPDVGYATGVGLLVGLLWVATAIGTNYLFERRTLRHFLITGGYHVARFGLIGLAFGLFG